MNKWKTATLLLLAVSIALGIFAFQADRETKSMEKDLVLQYIFSHHEMTDMLGRALNSFGEEKQLNENLYLTDAHLDKLTDVTGNATPIGKHADIPVNFDIYFSTPVTQAINELEESGTLTETTKNELKNFYDQATSIDEKIDQLNIENAGPEELRQELQNINDELGLGTSV